jgi:hypothetical protein
VPAQAVEEAKRLARAALGDDLELEPLRTVGAVVLRAAGRGIVRVEPLGARPPGLASQLAALGAPVPALIAGPIEAGGAVVTLWADLPDDRGTAPDPFGAMGRALARFHRAGDRLLAAGAAVPAFDPLGWLALRLAGADPGLGGALVERTRLLAPALAAGPATLLHTDAHAGNFRVLGDEAWLVDLEALARGPRLYDLAALEVTERRFGGDPERFRRFAGAYGADPDDPALGPLCDLRETLAVGFVAGLGHAAVARGRLADLESGRRHARWQAF